MTEIAPAPHPTQSLYRPFIWIGAGLVAFLALIRVFLPLWLEEPPPLPVLREIPDFSLIERSGRAITKDDLIGKITVVSFFFTNCPGPCPIISANMARIQEVFSGDSRVQLVSITVDPEDDTPAVLQKYAARYQADANQWWFLTGPQPAVYSLVQDGFFQLVTDNRGKPLDDGQYIFTHSVRVALVDGTGHLRGFFQGTTDEGRRETIAAVRQLERETR